MCWFVDGDVRTGALHVLQLQLSPPPPSSFAPIKSGTEDIPVPANSPTEKSRQPERENNTARSLRDVDLYGEDSVKWFEAEDVDDFAQLTLDADNNQLIAGARYNTVSVTVTVTGV